MPLLFNCYGNEFLFVIFLLLTCSFYICLFTAKILSSSILWNIFVFMNFYENFAQLLFEKILFETLNQILIFFNSFLCVHCRYLEAPDLTSNCISLSAITYPKNQTESDEIHRCQMIYTTFENLMSLTLSILFVRISIQNLSILDSERKQKTSQPLTELFRFFFGMKSFFFLRFL